MNCNISTGIADALQYHNDHLVPALAIAVAVDGKFPQKVLNEIRNALTHLSRAEVLRKSAGAKEEEALKEIGSACRHLQRTTLDCLKIAVIAYAGKSETAMRALLEDIELPASVHAKSNELLDRRKSLSVLEGQEPTDKAVSQYADLLIVTEN
ncbi:hypothetical protein [Leisingera sp. S232]|uniref:hypothetical protein n=1 Tax=Leisingera sp. S232 TaxID=3415132 RepID=UPI003C7B9E27